MTASPRPEPESETPENAGGEPGEISDAEWIDAFCEELMAALTKLERTPSGWSPRTPGRVH